MKKAILTALAGALVVATALPAAAVTTKVNGYFRTRFIVADMQKDKDVNPDKLVDQRFRAKITMSLNDYVNIVYYGEVDVQWGDVDYGTHRNDGGAVGADTVNLETKQIHVAFKVPDTPLSAKIGVISYADSVGFSLFATDMAGVRLDATLDSVKLTGVFSKWYAGGDLVSTPGIGSTTQENDTDLWSLKAHFTPVEGAKVSAQYYFINAQDSYYFGKSPAGQNHYLAVSGSYKLPMVALSGWFMYNTGTIDDAAPNGDDLDVGAYAVSVKGTFTVAGTDAFLHGFYFSGDDDATDSDQDSIELPAKGGESFMFYDDGLMILLVDVNYNSYGHTGYGMNDGINGGYGLWGVVLGAKTKVDRFWIKGALGFAGVPEDDRNTAATKREGSYLGTEAALRVGTKIADIVDVSLNGAYAWLGDFYDKTATGGGDPDGQYEGYVQVHISY